MKIGVDIWFENKPLDEMFGNSYYCIDWNVPVLPRTGEYILRLIRFLPQELKEQFKTLKAIDYFPLYFEGSYSEEFKKQSLFDFFNEPNNDRFILKEIEWTCDDEDDIDYPILYICPA